MKKLTKKQRREIYLRAADMINMGTTEFCCIATKLALFDVINDYILDVKLKKYCPELFLFKPKCAYCNSWFGDYNYPPNQQARIDCLLFCAAMTY